MTEQTIVTMRVPLGRGAFVMVEFDASQPVDFAPLRELNGARMAHRGAPLFLKTLKENGAGAPLLHSAPRVSQEWRNSSPSGDFLGRAKTVVSPVEEIREIRQVISEKASAMADLDRKLGPAKNEEQILKDAILGTHTESPTGLLIFRPAGRHSRRPLFARLTELSRRWGPMKSERRRLNGEIKSLERQMQTLQRIVEKGRGK